MFDSNDNFDEAAAHKFYEGLVKVTSEFFDVYMKSLTVCAEAADNMQEAAQEKVKFSAEECNMKYSIMYYCMTVYPYAVSLFVGFYFLLDKILIKILLFSFSAMPQIFLECNR